MHRFHEFSHFLWISCFSINSWISWIFMFLVDALMLWIFHVFGRFWGPMDLLILWMHRCYEWMHAFMDALRYGFMDAFMDAFMLWIYGCIYGCIALWFWSVFWCYDAAINSFIDGMRTAYAWGHQLMDSFLRWICNSLFAAMRLSLRHSEVGLGVYFSHLRSRYCPIDAMTSLS